MCDKLKYSIKYRARFNHCFALCICQICHIYRIIEYIELILRKAIHKEIRCFCEYMLVFLCGKSVVLCVGREWNNK